MTSNIFVIETQFECADNLLRSSDARLNEAISLTKAINLNVVGSKIIKIRQIRPSTLLGEGSVDSMMQDLQATQSDVVLIDCALSPIQQRNLEKIWQVKVIDRTALILEIFGERARTKEGVLQVELAHLTYQRSRLVRSWTHLERQRGGAGFLGGPGETQIEMDRRILDDKIVKLKKELENVKKTRSLQRKSRKKVPFPIVALVGYTNAGKSTLFNYLTGSDVFAKDLLFATLDPTMRILELPSKRKVILSDTVGFISDLPTELVAAFRATLEEVLEADLILHIRDISSSDTLAQKKDVENVLSDLGLSEKVDLGLFEVLNKMDLLDNQTQNALKIKNAHKKDVLCISAKNGDGIQELLQHIDDALSRNLKQYVLQLPFEDGKTLSWLYSKGAVKSLQEGKKYLKLELLLSEKDCAQLAEKYILIKK
ncbi:MAG: GTPase HflX [Alphaproteobacteria bacterium]